MLHPVIDVDLGHSSNQQLRDINKQSASIFKPTISANTDLQFTLVKHVDQFLRDQLVETGHEGFELLGNSLLDTVGGDQAETGRVRQCRAMMTAFDHASTHSTYSFLLSSLTSTSRPPGLRSTVTISPNLSSVVQKVSSMTSVMSFSLKANNVLLVLRRAITRLLAPTHNIQVKPR